MVLRNIITLITAISISLLLFSCQQNTTEKSEEKLVQAQNDSLTQNELYELEMEALADSLDMVYAKYADLLKDKKGGDYRNQLFYRKIHILQTEIDSLKTVINDFNSQEFKKESKPKNPVKVQSQDEIEIRDMILALNRSWVVMHKTKKPKEVLKYFNSQFLASWIMVEEDNSANAAFYTQNDFGNFLRDIIRNKELSYEFGNVKFFEIEVKNHNYFSVAYKCERREYLADVLQHKESVLVTIAGKKVKKTWKIASYAWIGFKYSEINISDTIEDEKTN